MMGMRTPKTYWAVNKRQVVNWRDCCTWLVDSFEFEFESAKTVPDSPIFVIQKCLHIWCVLELYKGLHAVVALPLVLSG
jgi:hypothetical protein